MIETADHEDRRVQFQAILSLGKWPHPSESVDRKLRDLFENDVHLMLVIESLVERQLVNDQVISKMTQLLGSESIPYDAWALAPRVLAPKDALPHIYASLKRPLKSPDETAIRLAIGRSLFDLGERSDEVLAALTQGLEASPGAAGGFGRVSALAKLDMSYRHRNERPLKWEALDALQAFGSGARASIPKIEELLDDSALQVRIKAREAIQAIAGE